MTKILSIEELQKKIKFLKSKNKKIVLCHGVFDIIHPGHIYHFNSAKKFGDILIISVTNDENVKKGHNRPAFNLSYRKKTLSELSVVDYVCESNSKDAVDIIKKIKPNIYCKGPDYKNFKDDLTNKIYDEIKALKSIGGKFKTTDDPIFSTSKLINTYYRSNSEQDVYLNKINKKYKKNKIAKILDQFKKYKILVIGESILDEYTFCDALGKSGKEPVLTMKSLHTEKYLGGSLAICRHLSTFCNKVTLLSYLGEKREEEKFIKKSLEKNISSYFLTKKNSPTIIKRRFIENINKIKTLGLYSLNDDPLDNNTENKFYKIIKNQIKKHDLVIISDYGHGLISKKIAKLITSSKKFFTLNAQINSSNLGHHTLDKFSKMNALIINANELRHEFRDNVSSISKLAIKLKNKSKAKNVLVTKGKDGAILVSGKKNFECPGFANYVVDKIGAGDAMLAITSLCFMAKVDEDLTLYLGSLAGAHAVQSISNSDPVTKSSIQKVITHQLVD